MRHIVVREVDPMEGQRRYVRAVCPLSADKALFFQPAVLGIGQDRPLRESAEEIELDRVACYLPASEFPVGRGERRHRAAVGRGVQCVDVALRQIRRCDGRLNLEDGCCTVARVRVRTMQGECSTSERFNADAGSNNSATTERAEAETSDSPVVLVLIVAIPCLVQV